ncbi:MAG: class I SAM-dependent methyltransferase [Chitinispirillales bacterium]|jgi:predicted TPR repeat methyltransferase|nr:class I SAM-dependent methyltransferase [Chitinispirillales bacterium]
MQYEALAPIYDRLMNFVEYDEWLGLIERVVERYCTQPNPNILELGAGTGLLGEALCGMDYQYTASDISFSMCKEARTKRGLNICAADAKFLPFKKQFNMAIFLYDGVNYLLTLDEYHDFFASVYDVLLPGGLFLFDITTRENSIKHFQDFLDFEDYGDISYVRHSYFDKATSIQHNDFTIYRQSEEKNEYYKKYTEKHRQKVFSVQEIEKAIPKQCFSVLGIWDEYTFKKYSAKSLRIHFLLRKTGDK